MTDDTLTVANLRWQRDDLREQLRRETEQLLDAGADIRRLTDALRALAEMEGENGTD